jgi:hypothetical protein
VVVEKNPYLPLSAVECAADEDDEDSPHILGDKLLPGPTVPPHLAERRPVPWRSPDLPVPHDHEIERARSGAGDRMQTAMCELLYGINSLRALSSRPLHNRPLGLRLVRGPPTLEEEFTCVNTPSHQLNDTAGPQNQPCPPLPITDAAPSHPTNTLNPTRRRLPRAELHPRPVTYPSETTIVRRGALKQRSSSTPHPRRALIRSASDTSPLVPSSSQLYPLPSQPPTHSGPDTDGTIDATTSTSTASSTTTRPRRGVFPAREPPHDNGSVNLDNLTSIPSTTSSSAAAAVTPPSLQLIRPLNL